MHRIVILAHRYDSFDRVRYFLHEIADVWRDEGLSVEVVFGPGPFVEADLAILHVDLTVVPADHLAYVRQYSRVLNGRVTDISKRRFSDQLVRPGDGYDGPVIVKTNRNCGGKSESRVARQATFAARWVDAMRARLGWRWRSQLKGLNYPILPSPAHVPRGVWRNRHLVVERFLAERQGDAYCLRTWVFLGDVETNSISYGPEPIVKSNNVTRREPVAEVPDELRAMRRKLGFDFGKFDYAIVQGRVVLYDVNRTPTVGRSPREQYLPRIRELANGLKAYLPSPEQSLA
ncbi:MAG: hypothetical protein WD534_01350 [Phycisphaeraceae bacterium]